MTIGWYNGWSPDERRRRSPVLKQLIASGALAKPTTCSICGHSPVPGSWSSNPVWFHDEDCSQPLSTYPICRSCHRTLHERFDQPAPWVALVARYATGQRWFEQLSMDPASLHQPFGVTYPNGLPPA